MRILLDTNILVRFVEPTHPHHEIAKRAIDRLSNTADRLCVVPQILYEFFVVCTRPMQENGGLGISNPQALVEIQRAIRLFEVVADSPAIYPLWLELIEQRVVIGKRAHDARIVAAMLTSQIPAILTFNLRDFQRYEKIQILDPEQIATSG